MADKKVIFTRWSLGSVFILATVLNNVWQGGKNLWAYWVSSLLDGGELTVFGLAFIFFPYFILKVIGVNKEDLKDNPKWMLIILCSIFGIFVAIGGINLLALITRRWMTECQILLCLPSVP